MPLSLLHNHHRLAWVWPIILLVSQPQHLPYLKLLFSQLILLLIFQQLLSLLQLSLRLLFLLWLFIPPIVIEVRQLLISFSQPLLHLSLLKSYSQWLHDQLLYRHIVGWVQSRNYPQHHRYPTISSQGQWHAQDSKHSPLPDIIRNWYMEFQCL